MLRAAVTECRSFKVAGNLVLTDQMSSGEVIRKLEERDAARHVSPRLIIPSTSYTSQWHHAVTFQQSVRICHPITVCFYLQMVGDSWLMSPCLHPALSGILSWERVCDKSPEIVLCQKETRRRGWTRYREASGPRFQSSHLYMEPLNRL
jgi:hypothetical protein